MDWHELLQHERRKRDRNYDPVLRWQHIQETITWAEENMPLHLQRNRPANRVAEERRKNARQPDKELPS
jgi:hypothetical protein